MLDPTNWQTPHAAARQMEHRIAAYPLIAERRPLFNLRSLGWSLITLIILAGLLGLFTIGAK